MQTRSPEWCAVFGAVYARERQTLPPRQAAEVAASEADAAVLALSKVGSRSEGVLTSRLEPGWVEWDDVPPGSLVVDRDGDEALRWPSPDAEGNDGAYLRISGRRSSVLGPHWTWAHHECLPEVRILRTGLTAEECDAIARGEGE